MTSTGTVVPVALNWGRAVLYCSTALAAIGISMVMSSARKWLTANTPGSELMQQNPVLDEVSAGQDCCIENF